MKLRLAWVGMAMVPVLAFGQSTGGVPALKEELAGEVARALAAEGGLQASIGAEAAARQQGDADALSSATAYTDARVASLKAAVTTPICRGRPGGTCSATTARACAYDADCPGGETCGWTQPSARFVDDGNGTVTDRRTCLVWEKKTGTPPPGPDPGPPNYADPHDVVNRYTWTTATSAPYLLDGTASTSFLKQLNDAAFAGHTDWRLPTSAGTGSHPTGNDPELESILTGMSPSCPAGPCIDPIFGPTQAYPHWSSSTYSAHPGYAWIVGFETGYLAADGKSYLYPVRAVRGGPGVP